MANATGLIVDRRRSRVVFRDRHRHTHEALHLESRPDRRDATSTFRPTICKGMVHRSALSPDGKWVLAGGNGQPVVEAMPGGAVRRFDRQDGRSGPEGSCTWAQWSPDGKWMYFTVDTRTAGFHVWRQRFPDGTTAAVDPIRRERGGRSRDHAGWQVVHHHRRHTTVHHLAARRQDRRQADHLRGLLVLTRRFHRMARELYYLRRATGSHSYFSGELWVSDVATGAAGTALCRLASNAFLNFAGSENSRVRNRPGPTVVGYLGRLAGWHPGAAATYLRRRVSRFFRQAGTDLVPGHPSFRPRSCA